MDLSSHLSRIAAFCSSTASLPAVLQSIRPPISACAIMLIVRCIALKSPNTSLSAKSRAPAARICSATSARITLRCSSRLRAVSRCSACL